jgi:hypothetical protein
MVAPAVPEYVFVFPSLSVLLEAAVRLHRSAIAIQRLTFRTAYRIFEEEDLLAAVDARTESLQNLRELGPPDLVYLIKQPKTGSTRQVSILWPS